MSFCTYSHQCMQLGTHPSAHISITGPHKAHLLIPNTWACSCAKSAQPTHQLLPSTVSSDMQQQQQQGGPGRPEQSVFYKTRLCNEFMSKGSCPFGPTCKYAHGEHELRPLAPEGQQILERLEATRARQQTTEGPKDKGVGKERGASGRGGPARHDEALRKTELCHDFQAGRCQYGDRCFYAHSQDELRPIPADYKPGGQTSSQQNQPIPGPPPLPMPGMIPGMGVMPGMMGMMGMPNMPGMGMPGGMPGMMPGMPQQPMMMGAGPMQGMMPHMQVPQQQQPSAMAAVPHASGPPSGPNRPDKSQDTTATKLPPKPKPPPLSGFKSGSDQRPPKPPATSHADAAGGGHSTARGGDAGASHISDPSVKAEVTYIERVRATCGVLNIGSASVFSKERPDIVQSALLAARNRAAYRSNAYADDVSGYLPQPAGGRTETARS